MTQLQSPLIKVFAKVSGGGKMAAGGAEVEARRLRYLIGCYVEVTGLTVSSHASCPDPEFMS